jgi:LysR family transcriptional regulator, transcriptional activator of the cysJI operon
MRNQLNYELIKYFTAVSESKSISKASEDLFVTQSAVSQAIKNLESQLDCKLFIRTSKGMNLTIQGKILYDSTKLGVKYFELGFFKVLDSKNLSFKSIRIASSETFEQEFIFPKIKEIQNIYKNAKIEFVPHIAFQDKLSFLLDNEIDIALIKDDGSFKNKDVDIFEISTLNYVFFYNKNFFNFTNKSSIENLKELPLILKSPTTRTKIKFNKIFNNEFIPKIQCVHDTQIVNLVEKGIGIGFAPREYLHNDNLKILELEQKYDMSTKVIAITIKGNDYMKKFISILQNK